MTTVAIGIVCAIAEEFEAAKAHVLDQVAESIAGRDVCVGTYQGVKVAIINGAMANALSAASTALLFSTYQPRLMLFPGIAGSLDPRLDIGDTLIGEVVFQAESQTHEQLRDAFYVPAFHKKADSRLVEIAKQISQSVSYRVQSGVMVSSDLFPAPPHYQDLFAKEKAKTIDMETAAFYQTCHDLEVPCLCIRSVSNPVTNSECEEIAEDCMDVAAKNAADFCFRLIGELLSQRKLKQFASPAEKKVAALVDQLSLEKHPEGGYFKRTYYSEQMVGVDSEEYSDSQRSMNSSIYYLLAGDDYSAWHYFKSSETWYHHQGSSITLHIFDSQSKEYRTVVVGDPLQDPRAVSQYTVDKNTWFAASVNDVDSYALCGCSVSPSFEYKDYLFCDIEQLKKEYAGYEDIIDRYAREEPVVATPST